MATPGRPDGGQGSTSGTTGSAADAVGDVAQAVKQKAGALLDDAKETARSRIDEQKNAAAEGVGDMAGALHEAARRRQDSAGNDLFVDLTDSAASGLDRLSSALRNKDVGSMLRDMESFARNQPVAFFGLALAAGFLAVRFLKASDPQAQTGGYQGYSSAGARSGSSSYSGSSYAADDARRRLGSGSSSNTYNKEDPWTSR